MLPALFHKPGAVLNIAHRGFSGQFPENTLAAFRGAIRQKADMIELDVQLTKDGVPVVFHDTELGHHSDGNGKVKDYTLSELQQLDAGSWVGADFAEEKIPTLEQVLHLARGTIALNIEIKTEAVTGEITGGIEQQCLELVKKYEMEPHVLFSSFDERALQHLKESDPQVSIGVLYDTTLGFGGTPSEIVKKYEADSFHCSYRQLTQKRLEDLKSHRIPIYVYTVDSIGKMKELINQKVNGIFTNRPDILRQTLIKIRKKGSS